MNRKATARSKRMLLAFAVGFVIFVLGSVLDAGLLGNLWPHNTAMYVDDFVIGVFCGALVLAYEERQHREIAKKLSIIGEMNHIVRNELEIIEYSAYATHNKEHIERIRTCVDHIDGALREVVHEKKPVQSEGIPRANSKRTFQANSK